EVSTIVPTQTGILSSLLNNAKLLRVSEYESQARSGGYSLPELLADVRHGIFSELSSNAKIDVYRRALQRAYVENLNLKLNPPVALPGAGGRGGGGGGGRGNAGPTLDPKLSDINAAARADLKELDAEFRGAIAKAPD